MTLLAITLTLNPTSPLPPTLLSHTLTTLLSTLSPTYRLFYGPSLTTPNSSAKILLATPSVETPSLTVQNTILTTLSPLSPHLLSLPTLSPLPIPHPQPRSAFPPSTQKSQKIPIDILHLHLPHPVSPTTRSSICRTVSLLTLSVAEASKPGGLDDNPCLESTCVFTSETEGWIWAVWKDEGVRESWMRGGGGRGNLRVLMGEEFGGVEFEGKEGEGWEEGFWEPVRWLGGEGTAVEGEGWGVEEVVREEEGGWWGWVRGLVGLG